MDEVRWQDEEQLVVFALGEELYGVRIGVVREIITWQQVTRVPHTPPYVEGVINLRGRVIPVIDLRRRLGLPSGERDRHTRIVVVEGEGDIVGMVVDAVSEVLTVTGDRVEPPSPYAGVNVDYVRGIAKLDDRLVILLDLDRVLAPEEAQAVSQAVAAAGGS
jgi:purine-binding chemotaxis protein CheW